MKKIIFGLLSLIILSSCAVTNHAIIDEVYYTVPNSKVKYYDHYSDIFSLNGIPIIRLNNNYYYQFYDVHIHMWYREIVPRNRHNKIRLNPYRTSGLHYGTIYKQAHKHIEHKNK